MPTSVLIVAPRADSVRGRAAALARGLRSCGYQVAISQPRSLVADASRYGCVITPQLSLSAASIAYRLQDHGIPWVAGADVDALTTLSGSTLRSRLARRLLLSADIQFCDDPSIRTRLFELLGISAITIAGDDHERLAQRLQALICPGDGAGLRVMMLGPVGSIHLEHLALAMKARGHAVHAGGDVWGGPSTLPEAGVPVSVMTRPGVLWIRRLVRRFRPNVIHANWMPVARVAAAARVQPLVAMAWGSDVYLADRRARLLNRLTGRCADLVLADSQDLLERVVGRDAPPNHAAIVNWGVDGRLFNRPSNSEKRALRIKLGLDDRPVIFSPRGLRPRYNPDVVIDAFSRIVDELPVQLVMGDPGAPEEDPGPRDRAGGRVRVLGRLPYDRYADYMRAADVYVSIPSSDSSPRSVWEAMACGCACVLSDLPWVHELLVSGEHALVVPINATAVANAIRRLLTDPELRRAVIAQASGLVEERRQADAEMDRLEAMYQRVASRPNGERL